MNKQEQKSGDNSTNIQANDIVVHQGLSYSEVKEVVLDVFRANFYELAGTAKDIARARAEEITENFLTKLQRENPAGLLKAEDPDFQSALFNVQKEHAKSGDKELGDLLVDLLVDRSKQKQRDILQIVLNESINTAPKLTDNQLAALAVIFLFRYTQNSLVVSHQSLGEYFDRYLLAVTDKIVKGIACYQHLEFSGCGSISISQLNLVNILGGNYQGLFLKGFDEKEIEDRQISVGLDGRFFVQCLNDPSKFQVRARCKEDLEESLKTQNIQAEDQSKIIALFEVGKMNEQEIKDKCIAVRPYMADVFDVWAGSAMKNFTLTSVGIAIGHANIKRLVGEFANLSIWIN